MHSEIGGLRWGRSRWHSWNASWPLVRLQATSDRITIRLRGPGTMHRAFVFAAGEPLQLRFRPGMLPCSTGLEIGHGNPALPPFLLFWTFRPETLRRALIRLGYPVNAPPNPPENSAVQDSVNES